MSHKNEMLSLNDRTLDDLGVHLMEEFMDTGTEGTVWSARFRLMKQ